MLAGAVCVTGAGHSPSTGAALQSTKILLKIPLMAPECLKRAPVLNGVRNEQAGIGIINLPEAQAPLALLFSPSQVAQKFGLSTH